MATTDAPDSAPISQATGIGGSAEAFPRAVERKVAAETLDKLKRLSREVLTDEGEAEVHLFRFRETPDEPWQAGLAGPYLKAEVPTCDALGGTFSRFEQWDECTPAEHGKRILQTVGAIRCVETPDGEKLFWS